MTTLGLLVVVAVLLVPACRVALPPAPARGARPSAQRPPARAATDAVALVETFAAALRSGLTPLEATRWCARQDGAPTAGTDAGPAVPDDVVAWWAGRVPAVARALAVAEHVGSPAADAVAAAADAEREREQLDRELAAGLAGVRATAWLLTALPVLGGVGVVVTSGPSLGPGALTAMAAGVVTTASGWLVLRRLVAGARRRALA